MTIENYKIELENVHIYAHHGVMQQEREIGAWFTLNISLEVNDHRCAFSDAIEETISYADVYDIIKQEMYLPSQLLEHVAARIMNRLFSHFAAVTRIALTITKDTPPMGGDRLQASVKMEARR